MRTSSTECGWWQRKKFLTITLRLELGSEAFLYLKLYAIHWGTWWQSPSTLGMRPSLLSPLSLWDALPHSCNLIPIFFNWLNSFLLDNLYQLGVCSDLRNRKPTSQRLLLQKEPCLPTLRAIECTCLPPGKSPWVPFTSCCQLEVWDRSYRTLQATGKSVCV